MKICSLFAMKFPVVFAIIATCFSGNLYGESLEPIIFARKADKAMIIDGKDTEPCYASAVPSEEFKKISGEKADPSSRVRVVYDAEKIYFFYDCDEPEIAGKIYPEMRWNYSSTEMKKIEIPIISFMFP